jgi:hypothetical protein
MKVVLFALLTAGVAASPTSSGDNTLKSIFSSLENLLPFHGPGWTDRAPVTTEIINSLLAPVNVGGRFAG